MYVLPYIYRKILKSLPNLTELCGIYIIKSALSPTPVARLYTPAQVCRAIAAAFAPMSPLCYLQAVCCVFPLIAAIQFHHVAVLKGRCATKCECGAAAACQ